MVQHLFDVSKGQRFSSEKKGANRNLLGRQMQSEQVPVTADMLGPAEDVDFTNGDLTKDGSESGPFGLLNKRKRVNQVDVDENLAYAGM